MVTVDLTSFYIVAVTSCLAEHWRSTVSILLTLVVSALSGTPCLICGRGEEARTDAVSFTLATAAQRSGSWWTLHPRTSLNRSIIQTHTDVRPLPAAFLTLWPGFKYSLSFIAPLICWIPGDIDKQCIFPWHFLPASAPELFLLLTYCSFLK